MLEMADIAYSSLSLNVPGIFENPRLKASASGIKELAASIEAHGLMNPLQVWEYAPDNGDVQFVVLGGSRRYQALGLLIERGVLEADMTVPCRLIGVDLVSDARSAALIDNIQREALSPFEMAKEVYELRTSGGMSGADLAKQLGKSAAWVSRHYTSWRDTADEVKKLWRKGALTTDEVQQLSKLAPEEQGSHATELVALRGKEDAGNADMVGRVKARDKVRKMKAKRSPKREAELDAENDAKAKTKSKGAPAPRPPAHEGSEEGTEEGTEEDTENVADLGEANKFASSLPDPAKFVLGRESIDMLIERVAAAIEQPGSADPYCLGVYDALRYVIAQMPFGSLSDKVRAAADASASERKAG